MYRNKFIVCASCLVFSSGPAFAEKEVKSPYVKMGFKEIEVKNTYAFDDGEEGDAWETEVSGIYSPTSFWEAELGVGFEDEGRGEDVDLSEIVMENKFMLAQPGEFFIDPGFEVDYTFSTLGGADELAGKLLLAKTVGPIQEIANFEVAHEIGEGAGDDLNYGFANSLSYLYDDHGAVGFEWFSDFGNFEDGWDDQSHQVGPVAYGHALGLHYDVGVLAGISKAAPDAELKLNLGYHF